MDAIRRYVVKKIPLYHIDFFKEDFLQLSI